MGRGLEGKGSLLAGLTLAASGCIFAGIGGLCAHIFEHRGSAGWACLALEAWFLITHPFGENYAWKLLVLLCFPACR